MTDHAASAIMLDEKPKVLADGFCFTECPRWRDGWFYFSDIFGKTVYRVNEAGTVETVVRLDVKPAGLGWTPNGDMLIVSMEESKVLRLADGEISVHADLSAAADGLNDMVVDQSGRAYVSKFAHPPTSPEPIIVVEPDGSWYESEDKLLAANGMVLTADGKSLLVSEPAGCRVGKLDLNESGVPSNARVFAQLNPGQYPDGIGGDDHGGAWVAAAFGPGVFRVEEGSVTTHLVPYGNGRFAYACALGGSDGNTLFICVADQYSGDQMQSTKNGAIEILRVPFRQSGVP